VEIFRVTEPLVVWKNGLVCKRDDELAVIELRSVEEIKHSVDAGTWNENWSFPDLFDQGYIIRVGIFLVNPSESVLGDPTHDNSSHGILESITSSMHVIAARWFPALAVVSILN
jgi:hypothetical protein